VIDLDFSDERLAHDVHRIVRAVDHASLRVRVGDRFDRPSDILVVPVTPLACARAIHALLSGRAMAVLCADELHRFPEVFRALGGDWAPLPRRVRDAAARLTPLSDREHAVVLAALAGRSLRLEATEQGVSESTMRRDLRAALRQLRVTGRDGLAELDR
jgi:DNA-binding NarL/FixJ family response regulator